jgi:hypothetical protein
MEANDGNPAGEAPDSGERKGSEGVPEPAYHLLLAPEEAPVLHTALDLLISDARDGQIRELARAVIARLPGSAGASATGDGDDERDAPLAGVTSIPLQPREMKIVHTAVHVLLDDLQREQAGEIEILQQIIEKLPDEHAIRAISLD